MNDTENPASTAGLVGQSHPHAFRPAKSRQSSTAINLAAEALHKQALASERGRSPPFGGKCQASSQSDKMSMSAVMGNPKLHHCSSNYMLLLANVKPRGILLVCRRTCWKLCSSLMATSRRHSMPFWIGSVRCCLHGPHLNGPAISSQR